jgi:formamidopyrimidine-DNA glycosylase
VVPHAGCGNGLVPGEHVQLEEMRLDTGQRRALYDAILNTVREVIDQGGRYDEYDLYGHQGKYVRIMDRHALERPCPECGGDIEKIQYLGGSCYLCPNCQG